jgi:hypothetical protein
VHPDPGRASQDGGRVDRAEEIGDAKGTPAADPGGGQHGVLAKVGTLHPRGPPQPGRVDGTAGQPDGVERCQQPHHQEEVADQVEQLVPGAGMAITGAGQGLAADLGPGRQPRRCGGMHHPVARLQQVLGEVEHLEADPRGCHHEEHPHPAPAAYPHEGRLVWTGWLRWWGGVLGWPLLLEGCGTPNAFPSHDGPLPRLSGQDEPEGPLVPSSRDWCPFRPGTLRPLAPLGRDTADGARRSTSASPSARPAGSASEVMR